MRAILAAFTVANAARAAWTPWGRRQGSSEARFARVTAGRQRPPRRLQQETTCDPPKRIGLNVMQAISSNALARKRLTHREPTRRGCSYEEREMAEVGPTHRASPKLKSRKAIHLSVTLAKELSARMCWRTRAAAPRWERCAKPCSAFQKIAPMAKATGLVPGCSWYDGRRPDRQRGVTARCAAMAVLVARVNARGTSRGVLQVSCPSVLEPARWCPRWRHGTSEIGFITVKATPADEARVVRHTRRREALTLDFAIARVTRWMRKRHRVRVSRGGVDRSWPVRIARPSWPTARTARTEPGRDEDAHGVTKMRGMSHVHNRRLTAAIGPRVRP